MTVQDPRALLGRLLQEKGEAPWLEFKQNNSNPYEIGACVSACANAAILAGKERAFIVFGIEDKTKRKVGTEVRLNQIKKGGENFSNWISHQITPRLKMEFLDFEDEGLSFAILCIEPTYDRPVRFEETEYIRVGENTKKLKEFPEHERSLWQATGRYRFENAIAASHQTADQVLEKLNADIYFELAKVAFPENAHEIIRTFLARGFIREDMEGGFDITNLGAILFARDIRTFPSIAAKSIRVIKYAGKDKRKSDRETEGQKGYAVGFSALIRYVLGLLPTQEAYKDGVRVAAAIYPEIAIREFISNALIHQDFTIAGVGPIIEVYDDRVEVINPGNSLIEVDRIIDERRSRNEQLAATMRGLGLCEERGGGIDKAILEIEEKYLPAPKFIPSENSMTVVLFGPKKFGELSKADKIWACFCHCVVRWIRRDYMTNTSLRARFSLTDEEYQLVSGVISDARKGKRIVPAEEGQGKRNARYVPYWAR